MNEFAVTVVGYPQKVLTGLKVRTSMQKAQSDCPSLWQDFGARFGPVLTEGDESSYGVCRMVNDEEFDYWAAIEDDDELDVETGLDSFEIKEGLYAKITVPDLDRLGDAFTFLYTKWPNCQSEYTPDSDAPSFELYPPNWQPTDAFEVFVPVK